MGTVYPSDDVEPRGIEFIPTLGNMIKECDAIIKSIPPYLRDDYAKLFNGTEIETLLFSTKNFEEAACEYCREAGWSEPR